jgi:enoyl-CoA hydratase/carnithine racemase
MTSGMTSSEGRKNSAPRPDAGDLAVTTAGAVATLWLNRPTKRNAVTYEMWNGIAAQCRNLAGESDVRVLVIRGVGDHFCAGADITGLGGPDPAAYQAANRAADDAIAAFPKPTIAFVSGSCVGGGSEIAVACDLRIADTTARFGITPARLGIVYPAFAVERVVRLIGPAATKHLLYSAELIDADRALRVGLVDEVHAPDEAAARLEQFTRLLATERSLLSQMASKEMVDAAATDGLIDVELSRRWGAEVAATAESAEGIAAFVEHRSPQFTWTPPAG